nr:zinc finger protein 572-like [Parasteatoda tepidariorum]
MLKELKRKIHRCPYCAYITPYSSNIYRHVRSHTKDKQFICHFCLKTFASEEICKAHTDHCPKEYGCDECGIKFSRHSDFTKHYLKIHQQVEQCDTVVVPNDYQTAYNF